jgi:hypothetical protein
MIGDDHVGVDDRRADRCLENCALLAVGLPACTICLRQAPLAAAAGAAGAETVAVGEEDRLDSYLEVAPET